MKKILLLTAVSCFMMLQTKIVFGKCDPHFDLKLTPGSFTSNLFACNGAYYLVPGDTLVAHFYFTSSWCTGCSGLTLYQDGNIIQQNTASVSVTEPGTYLFQATCASLSFIIKWPPFEPPAGNWLYSIKAVDGTFLGHTGITDNYSAVCSIHLTSYAESVVTGHSMTGFPVDWYLDSVFQFTRGGTVEFSQPGLIYYRVNPTYNFYSGTLLQLTNQALSPYQLLINTHSESCTGTMHDTIMYNVSGDYCLLSAYEQNPCFTRDIGVRWLLNNSYYASTSPGEMLSVNYSGLIAAVDTINNITSSYKILLRGAKLHSVDSPEMLNLHYKIINLFGREIEQGDAQGYGILRTKNAKQALQSGIYFVIYSNALDNRQVLTDKVVISSQ